MVVSVHLLSLCTLFSRASLGTLHDAPGYEDRSSDLPVWAHTPATLRHLLRVRPSSFSPADLRPGLAVGVSEVSRFSCMKFLGVSGVFDYAGLSRCSRYRACSCCLPRITKTSASGFHLFGAEYPPRLSPVYASLCPSR